MTWSKTLLFFQIITVQNNCFGQEKVGDSLKKTFLNMEKLRSTSAGWSYRAKLQTTCFICSFANGKLRTFPSQNLADVIEGFKTADFFKDTSHFLLEDLSLGAKDALNSILCSIDDSESLIQRQTGLLESLDLQLWTQKRTKKFAQIFLFYVLFNITNIVKLF